MNVNDKTLAGFNVYRRYDPFELDTPKKKFCRAAFDRLLRYNPFMSDGGPREVVGVSQESVREVDPPFLPVSYTHLTLPTTILV